MVVGWWRLEERKLADREGRRMTLARARLFSTRNRVRRQTQSSKALRAISQRRRISKEGLVDIAPHAQMREVVNGGCEEEIGVAKSTLLVVRRRTLLSR